MSFVCELFGHKYRLARTIPETTLLMGEEIYVCERCKDVLNKFIITNADWRKKYEHS